MQPILTAALVLAAGCASSLQVETQSRPVELRVQITGACASGAHVESRPTDPFTWVRVAPTEPGRYSIEVPAMRGSDAHDPARYPALRIRVDGTLVHELSIADVRALPHDPGGAAVVDLRC